MVRVEKVRIRQIRSKNQKRGFAPFLGIVELELSNKCFSEKGARPFFPFSAPWHSLWSTNNTSGSTLRRSLSIYPSYPSRIYTIKTYTTRN